MTKIHFHTNIGVAAPSGTHIKTVGHKPQISHRDEILLVTYVCT
jgi:hypothetical protein